MSSLLEEESISRLLKSIEKEERQRTTRIFPAVRLESEVIEKSKKIWVNWTKLDKTIHNNIYVTFRLLYEVDIIIRSIDSCHSFIQLLNIKFLFNTILAAWFTILLAMFDQAAYVFFTCLLDGLSHWVSWYSNYNKLLVRRDGEVVLDFLM